MKKRIISILSMLVLVCFLLVGAPTSMTAKAAADPAFTKQPVGGEVIYGEELTVSWSLNFTPTEQRVSWKKQGEEMVHTLITLDASATSAKLSGLSSGLQYVILAYYNEGGVEKKVASDLFQITNVAPYTADSVFKVGGTMTVDTECIAAANENWEEAYFDNEITYQWYRNGTAISGATMNKYEIQRDDVGCELYAKVIRSDASLKTSKVTASCDIYVGGVGMCNGEYLASNATAPTTTKPSGGYAYYKDGVLTLHNYTYSGSGYQVSSNTFAAVYAAENVTVKLEGENSITKTSGGAKNEYAFYMKSNLALQEGTSGSKLTVKSSGYGILVQKNLTIESGTYNITAEKYDSIYVMDGNISIKAGAFVLKAYRIGMLSNNGGMTIENGSFDVAATTDYGIYSDDDMTIKNGDFTIVSKKQGLLGDDNVTIENGTFDITSYDSYDGYGIQADGKFFIIKDGDFTINSKKTAIYSAYTTNYNGAVTIEGGSFNITSQNGNGILAEKNTTTIRGGEIVIDSAKSAVQSVLFGV